MLQRILGVVLVLAGLGAIAFGVATATVLRESDTVAATARPTGDGTFVVTDPGVLDLVDSEVTVTASVPAGQQVAVVVGRDVDVTGWIGDDPYTRVTGLTDWDTLSTEQVAGSAEEDADAEASEDAEGEEAAEPPPTPAGSDMWDTELVDAEQVTLRWTDRPGRWVLLAAATGPAPVEETEGEEGEQADAEEAATDVEAPTLELTWDREVSTPLLWPAVGAGGVLLLVGVVLLLAGRRSRKKARTRRAGSAATASPVTSPATSSPTVGDPGTGSGASGSSAASPFGPTTGAAAGAAGAATWRTGGSWPETVSTSSDDATSAQDDATVPDPQDDDSTGTAPVPVAGRFRRRSRLRRDTAPAEDTASPSAPAPDAPAPDAPTAGAPVPAPAPALPTSPAGPESSADAEETSADAVGRPLTRRELRRREEERRAAGPSGMGRALRALTGQTPVVPGPGGPAGPQAPSEPGEAPSAESRRASAWRETWGFGGTTGGTTPAADDDTTDEDKR
ncbi:hypothetical protein [Isoptericola haloaureus]|uniref:LPXTG-motif cell wall-anchored protein n=1 Tax=Isoptericola haloaureus TaxID=1542902 RepID=A0ABU7Z443_9MICO